MKEKLLSEPPPKQDHITELRPEDIRSHGREDDDIDNGDDHESLGSYWICLRWKCNCSKVQRMWSKVQDSVIKFYEMNKSDPRKLVFGAKMGLALSLISLLIFLNETSISDYSIWAVMTVVVVFEFSVGATFSKGMNRALGTLSAGTLSVGIGQLSTFTGILQDPIIVISVFVAGFCASYVKLYPTMKDYEYGFRVFLITYCIVLVSDSSDFLETAVARLLLIALGAILCLFINTLVYPIWAGEDLHKLVVKNFRGVANSLEGCVNGYLHCVEYKRVPSKILTFQPYDEPLYNGYRSAVESASQEDSLMTFALWEPPHGQYRMCNYPWSLYVKVSGALRHCALMVMAMHGCMLSEIQAPVELREVFSDKLKRVGIEGSKVLQELGDKVEKMEKLCPEGNMLSQVQKAAQELQMLIDQKSYLLVNVGNWEQHNTQQQRGQKVFTNPESFNETMDDNVSPKPAAGVVNTTTTRSADQLLVARRQSLPTLQRNFSSQHTTANMSFSISRQASSEDHDLYQRQISWPSRLLLDGDCILNEREVRTFESATALSVTTFMSSLIEFVARLQNLVNAFVELSEKANFKDPHIELGVNKEKEDVGCWAKLLPCC